MSLDNNCSGLEPWSQVGTLVISWSTPCDLGSRRIGLLLRKRSLYYGLQCDWLQRPLSDAFGRGSPTEDPRLWALIQLSLWASYGLSQMTSWIWGQAISVQSHMRAGCEERGQSFKLEVSRERSQNARATSFKQQAPSYKRQATSLPQLDGRLQAKQKGKLCKLNLKTAVLR